MLYFYWICDRAEAVLNIQARCRRIWNIRDRTAPDIPSFKTGLEVKLDVCASCIPGLALTGLPAQSLIEHMVLFCGLLNFSLISTSNRHHCSGSPKQGNSGLRFVSSWIGFVIFEKDSYRCDVTNDY